MSSLVSLHGEIVNRLKGKAALRGVPIVSRDDQEYYRQVESALAELFGACVAIGNPDGVPEATEVPGGQFQVHVRAYVFENQAITRARILTDTVDDETARLALSGLAAGDRVHQSDVDADFWLMEAGGEADAANWAPVQFATGILELVIRSLQLWKPTGYQSMVSRGFEPGTAEDTHNYVARFSLMIGLDPTPVT